MDFLKRQLFMIICGVVAAGSIILGVIGVQSMSTVEKEMNKAQGLASKLPGLVRGPDGPINEKSIEAQQKRIEAIRGYYDRVLEWAYQRNRMEPLLPESFPNPDRDHRLAFREAYFTRFDEFLKKLDAGTVATDDEIEEARIQIEEEGKAEKFFGVDRSEAARAGEAIQEAEDQPVQYPSGLLTDHGGRTIPAARANLIKAHGMRCYATRRAFEIFGDLAKGITPSADAMWDAQLSLWVQESVVDALARVNDRAAEEVRQAGQTPWVGLMPVKELISIRTSTYVVPASEPAKPASPSGDAPASPPGAADEVFTHTVSNDLFEVVQFTVKMVVDARKIPTIVDEICRDNFHTLLRIEYEDVGLDSSLLLMKDRIYGSDPTVRIVMDFETVFFGDLYRSMMPNPIRVSLGLAPLEDQE